MGFLDRWKRLSAWIRVPVACLILLIGTLAMIVAESRLFVPLTGIGLILLFMGPSDAEENGYHF